MKVCALSLFLTHFALSPTTSFRDRLHSSLNHYTTTVTVVHTTKLSHHACYRQVSICATRKRAASSGLEEQQQLIYHNSDIIKLIFAIFIPPIGVFLERGCGADLLINILLTILGYIPGIIHAMYVTTSFARNALSLTVVQLHHPQILDVHCHSKSHQ